MEPSQRGCARHLAISAGLTVLIGVGVMVWHWDTFSMILSNMRSMGEGATVANEIASPGDLLDYLATEEGVSLVAFDLDAPDEGVFFRADSARPVIGLPTLLLLSDVAGRVARGAMDTTTVVPLDRIAALQLPGQGQGHTRAVAAMRERGRIQGDSIALGAVIEAMIRWNDDAATDYMLLRWGSDEVGLLPEQLGVSALDAPVPSAGTFLTWRNHTQDSIASTSGLAKPSHSREMLVARAYAYAETLRADTTFRRQEEKHLQQRGMGLTLEQQRQLAAATFPRGTARAYASLLARIASSPAPGDSLVRTYLERPVGADTMNTVFQRLATESGAFPGLLCFAGYARRQGKPPRVLVLLMENVPMAVFYHLLQTGIDRGFQVQLMGDDAFFEHVRQRLADAEAVESTSVF